MNILNYLQGIYWQLNGTNVLKDAQYVNIQQSGNSVNLQESPPGTTLITVPVFNPRQLFCFWTGTIGSGVTQYFQFGNDTNTTGITDFRLFLPACTAQNLRVSGKGTTTAVDSSFTCSLVHNGIASNLSVTVPLLHSGAWATPVLDSTDTITILDGDSVCIQSSVAVLAGNNLTSLSVYMETV